MAFETGTIASAAAALSVIQAFAQANGWTLTGNILSKGDTYAQLTSPSASELRIQGCRDGINTAPDICPRFARIYHATWPASATYYLASHSVGGVDTIWFTMLYNNTTYNHLGFGNLAKYGTWDGGQWFHGHHSSQNGGSNVYSTVDGGEISIYGGYNDCALFWDQRDGRSWDSNPYSNKCSFFECNLRGNIWESTPVTGNDLDSTFCVRMMRPLNKSSPNAFNDQTVLIPFSLFLQNTDGHYMSVGHVEHVRWLKMTNYNPGDIIQIGSDRWMVFPWHRKDILYPNGYCPTYSNSGLATTGILGVAVRYDGP